MFLQFKVRNFVVFIILYTVIDHICALGRYFAKITDGFYISENTYF